VRAMQRTQFRAKSAKNDLKPTDFLKRNFYFETEGVMKKKINNDKRRDMVVGKVVVHLCLALIIILKFSVEHDRVVTTLNLIRH